MKWVFVSFDIICDIEKVSISVYSKDFPTGKIEKKDSAYIEDCVIVNSMRVSQDRSQFTAIQEERYTKSAKEHQPEDRQKKSKKYCPGG